MIDDVATSTVASSVFSMLNVNGGMPLQNVRAAMSLQGFDCTQEALEEAVRALVNRHMITFTSGVLESRYPRHWVMVRRDRDEPSGWHGWVMKNQQTNEHKALADLEPVR